MDITREELKSLIDTDGDYILIDVRNKDELVHGVIPTSKNIPFTEIHDALNLSDQNFELTYKFSKPTKTSNIIFHCRTGGRSAIATKTAEKMGFQARNYPGSIWEWSEYDSNVQRYGPSP